MQKDLSIKDDPCVERVALEHSLLILLRNRPHDQELIRHRTKESDACTGQQSRHERPSLGNITGENRRQRPPNEAAEVLDCT